MGVKNSKASDGNLNLRENDGKPRTLEEWRALNPNVEKTQDALLVHQKETEAANYRFRRNFAIFIVLFCLSVFFMVRLRQMR